MWFNGNMRAFARLLPFLIALVALSAGLTSCGTSTPAAGRTPTPTATRTPTPKPSATPTATPTPVDALTQALNTWETQVLTVQGITAAPEISRQRLAPEAFAARLSAFADQPLCPLPDTFAWQALDLWPTDAGEITAATFADDAPPPAFFDPADATIYFTAPDGVTPALQHAYVRAYARALLHAKHPLPATDDPDRCLAQQALIEGVVAYTEYLWFFSYGTPQVATPVATATPGEPAPQPPLAAVKYRGFPTDAGFAFVYMLSQQGGWPSIWHAFAAPPVSTEQVMHPERYPDDQPQAVALPEAEALAAALGEGWQEEARGVMDEALLHLMLTASTHEEARLLANDAADAAEGWGGGSWVVLHQAETGELALLADVYWDTGPDAVAFIKAFVRHVRGRFGPLDDRAYRVLYWENNNGAAVIRYNSGERRTVWVFAPTRAQAEALLTAAHAPGTGE